MSSVTSEAILLEEFEDNRGNQNPYIEEEQTKHYHFLSLLNMNQVPEKLYYGQWPYIAELYQVNEIWLLK
jgi:hypothetical protein